MSKCVCERKREKVQKSAHGETRGDRRCNPVCTEERSCKDVEILREKAKSAITHHFLAFLHSSNIKYRGYINDGVLMTINTHFSESRSFRFAL